MAVIGLVALGLTWIQLAVPLVLSIGTFLAVRALWKGDASPRTRRWSRSYLVSVPCLYLPFAWLVLQDYPWDSYRRGWILLWPVLPGLAAGMFFHPNDAVEFLISGLASLLLVAGFTALGARGSRWLVASAILVLIVAGLASRLAYVLFLF